MDKEVNEIIVEKSLRKLGFKLDTTVLSQKWFLIGQCSISLGMATAIVEEYMKSSPKIS